MNLIDLIFPKNCLICKSAGRYLCEECVSKVRKVGGICPVCNKGSIDGFTHIKCKKKYGVDGLVSVFEYEGVIRKAIIALKYKYSTEIIGEIVDYSLKVLKDRNVLVPNYCTLVPIPMHWLKENSRGFNQSYELGKQVAEKMGWEFTPNILVRTKLNTPQAQLSGKERVVNIKNVFALAPNIDMSQYRNITLFDDVYTTGSTLKEATKVLKRSGTETVWGLTIAR